MFNQNQSSFNPNQSNFEIEDVENYRSDKQHVFNHQMLVMEVLRRVNEAGSHELRSGWFNEKVDNQGSLTRIYIEDTRKKYVECVKSAMSVMACDYDKKAREKIDKAQGTLKNQKKILLNSQWNWYITLPPKPMLEFRGKVIKGFFNYNMGWYSKFIELEVSAYRNIAKELNNLTKRLDFYKSVPVEG